MSGASSFVVFCGVRLSEVVYRRFVNRRWSAHKTIKLVATISWTFFLDIRRAKTSCSTFLNRSVRGSLPVPAVGANILTPVVLIAGPAD